MGDEVVDLDDERVLDLGEETLLGDRRGRGRPLSPERAGPEDDPTVGDIAVAGEVDPSETAVASAPATSYCPPRGHREWSFGVKEYAAPHFGQKPPRAWSSVDGAAHRRPADRAVALVLRDLWVGIDRLAASTAGAGGTRVSPAPSRAERSLVDPLRTRRVADVPTRADPNAAEPNRVEALAVEGVWPIGVARVASSSIGPEPTPAPRTALLVGSGAAAEPPTPAADPGVPQTSQ